MSSVLSIELLTELLAEFASELLSKDYTCDRQAWNDDDIEDNDILSFCNNFWRLFLNLDLITFDRRIFYCEFNSSCSWWNPDNINKIQATSVLEDSAIIILESISMND